MHKTRRNAESVLFNRLQFIKRSYRRFGRHYGQIWVKVDETLRMVRIPVISVCIVQSSRKIDQPIRSITSAITVLQYTRCHEICAFTLYYLYWSNLWRFKSSRKRKRNHRALAYIVVANESLVGHHDETIAVRCSGAVDANIDPFSPE